MLTQIKLDELADKLTPDLRLANGQLKHTCGMRYSNVDFTGEDFSGLDMSGSVFRNCTFDNANLTDANCENSDFTGSRFVRTTCTRTNFRNAKLACTTFEPDDAYGITITLTCKTFENAMIGQMWWYGWLMFLSSMIPASRPVPEDLRAKLLGLIGSVRFLRLKNLFQRREM